MKNLCLLGAGRMGALHAQSFLGQGRARLSVVADVVPAVADALAAKMGARAVYDPLEAIGAPDVDGVIIATATNTHVELILAAAEAGRPIFCEKPIDLDLGRVDRCLRVVRERGVPLQLGFNRRFDPSFRDLHDRLRAGEVGDVEVVSITSRDPAPPPLSYVRVSGGLFRDMMIHDLDMARWLLGAEPVAVSASASCLVDPAIGEAGDVDTAVVTLQTETGALCCIQNSRRAVYGYDQRIEVHGARGMLQAKNPLPTTVTRWGQEGSRGDPLLHFTAERYPQAYRAELEHFLDVIDGAAPSPNGHDGRAALVLADACLESLRSGRRVAVSPS